MKKLALALVAALLAVPTLAQAKTGVVFDKYPDTAKTGEQIKFTVMVLPEGPSSGGPNRFEGRHPLIIFRSESGRVVHVRATAADLNGIAYGSVAFPDRGPWSTEMKIGNVIQTTPDNSEPIHVGIGLTQTIPSADQTSPKPAAPDAGSVPWALVLSLAAIGSGLAVLLMRRRGHWGAA